VKANMMEPERETQGYGTEVFPHGSLQEEERLSLIEEEQDPYTVARIEAFGIAPDWHCLEIGSGKGSMAYWLADRCPDGRVVATDLDVSLLKTEGRPSLEICRHDITTDDFAPGSFHLIHARGVLTHVSDAESVCRRMARWLRPGDAESRSCLDSGDA
jgi:2-polyprenyl-3-methyl-5-hydroxy-6-metoxy-1,4-benzoquinol methylase